MICRITDEKVSDDPQDFEYDLYEDDYKESGEYEYQQTGE